jgi:uncharacterized protein
MSVSLHDRLRGIISGRQSAVPVVRRPEAPALAGARRMAGAADVLGGTLLEQAAGACLIVERHYEAAARHGHESIGAVVETLREGGGELALLGRAWPSAAGLDGVMCLLDLETTGLAGGAGTQAFLIGCAVVAPDGVRVRQFLMPGLEHERAQLDALTAWIRSLGTASSAFAGEDASARASAGVSLITFNGRTFDVPLVETRYLYHRAAFPLGGFPHLDMLHPARRLWRDAAPGSGCALTTLERQLAGVHRVGDVPGFEIPSRYFQFVRDGDARPLEAVLEHNRLDLLSTALLMARALRLIARGPSAASSEGECLGLGRLYERAGAYDEAEAAFHQAAALASRLGRDAPIQAEALKRLAMIRRRAGRVGEAMEAWTAVLAVRGCSAAVRREAREALAIHHEHRSRDLEEARLLVLAALEEAHEGRRRAEAEHRLRRLERKIGGRHAGGQMDLR